MWGLRCLFCSSWNRNAFGCNPYAAVEPPSVLIRTNETNYVVQDWWMVPAVSFWRPAKSYCASPLTSRWGMFACCTTLQIGTVRSAGQVDRPADSGSWDSQSHRQAKETSPSMQPFNVKSGIQIFDFFKREMSEKNCPSTKEKTILQL